MKRGLYSISLVPPTCKRWQHDSITRRCRCRSSDLLVRELVLWYRHCSGLFPNTKWCTIGCCSPHTA